MNITLKVTAPEIPEDFNINNLTEEVAEKIFKKMVSRTPDYYEDMRC